MPLPISVIILTFNEEKNLPDCLSALDGLAGMALKVRYALRRVNCRRCGVVVEAEAWVP